MCEAKPFILTVDCEGGKYTRLSGLTMEQAVCNADLAVGIARKLGFPIVLMAAPRFAKAAFDAGAVTRWRADAVAFGLHVHPDDLPDEITRGLAYYRPGETLLAAYAAEAQRGLLERCVRYVRSCGWEPEAFRGGFFSYSDDTARALRGVSGIRWESHNERRREYRAEARLLEPRPILSDPAAGRYAYGEPPTCPSLCFEDHSLEELTGLAGRCARHFGSIVGITHSIYLDGPTRRKLAGFADWLATERGV